MATEAASWTGTTHTRGMMARMTKASALQTKGKVKLMERKGEAVMMMKMMKMPLYSSPQFPSKGESSAERSSARRCQSEFGKLSRSDLGGRSNGKSGNDIGSGTRGYCVSHLSEIFGVRSARNSQFRSSSFFGSNRCLFVRGSFGFGEESLRMHRGDSNSGLKVRAVYRESASIAPASDIASTKVSGSEVLITIENLSKTFDGMKILFENFNFTLIRGQKVGILGRNGSGKSTLLKVLAGVETPDAGTIQMKKDIKIGYLPQDPKLNDESTIMESILSSDSPVILAAREYENLSKRQTDTMSDSELAKFKNQYQRAFERMESLKAWDCVNEAKKYLEELGLGKFSDSKIASLSGGQKKRVALISALISNPDVLILDEPTNHMDIQMIDWMEKQFVNPNTTLILVSHDRYFLDKLCTEMVEMDKGKHYRHFGNYTNFLESNEKRLLDKEKEISRFETILKRESEWMKKQPKARSTKSRSRINNFFSLTEKAARDKDEKSIQLEVGQSRLGDKIMIMKNATVYWEDRPIFKQFFYEFEKGEKIGIMGKNGVGKSTFLDVLAGRLDLNEGTREPGETLVIGYFTQNIPNIPEEVRAIDFIKQFGDRIQIDKQTKLKFNSSSSTSSEQIISASNLLERFGFPKSKQYDWVSKLSGGEKKRLFLASILIQKPNFLILDEPTNDLDLDTIEILESFLQNFDGCAVIVSHDRRFMDRIVNKIFLLEGNGSIKLYDGGYVDFMDDVGLIEEKSVQPDMLEAKKELKHGLSNKKEVVKTGSERVENVSKKTEKKKLRLSYMEKKEYEKIEGEIENLSKEKEKIELQIESAASANDYEKITSLSQKLANLILSIDTKTERWLELAEIAE